MWNREQVKPGMLYVYSSQCIVIKCSLFLSSPPPLLLHPSLLFIPLGIAPWIFRPYYSLLNCCIYSFHTSIIFSIFVFTLCPHLSHSLIVSCNLLSSLSLCAKYILDFASHSLLFPSRSFPYFCFCVPYYYFSLISLQNIHLSIFLTIGAYNFFCAFCILTFPLTSFHLFVCLCLLLAIFQERTFSSVMFVETVTGQSRNDNGNLIRGGGPKITGI